MTDPIFNLTGAITTMVTVQVTVVTAKADLPANITQSGIKVTLTDSAGIVQTSTATSGSTPPYTVTFDNVAAGAGTLQADGVDASGAVIPGFSVSGPFDTGGTTGSTQGDAPTSFTVTVS
jgi:hypothetical protein